jgi:LmbE family N-acetylglucosaminyl deacetylase
MARGFGTEAAYLSLTRGDGGQNLIGPELGVGLGLLRSRELEAARTIDGASQFVTRAFDFGYTRSLDETLRRWPYDSILKDAVRIVRRFRPHAIVSVFSGSSRDGHGQHQMAGRIAHAVYEAAGDPDQFPELEWEEDLPAWQALKLYRSTRFRPEANSFALATGAVNPRDGRTYHQIAMASRSMHASQDMGRLQRTGPGTTSLGLVEDRTGTGGDPLLAGLPHEGLWLATTADSLRRTVGPARMSAAAAPLNAALLRWRAEGGGAHRDSLLSQAIATAAGVVIDVTADTPHLVPGSAVTVTLQLYNGGPFEVQVDAMRVLVPERWTGAVSGPAVVLAPGEERQHTLAIAVPDDAAPSQPYFLRAPRIGDLYDWSPAPAAALGRLFEPPLMTGETVVRVAGGPPIVARREVTYRYNDQAAGEIRRPVTVVPGLSVRLDPAQLVWSTEGPAERELTVTVTSFMAKPVAARVTLAIGGWDREYGDTVVLERRGETRSLSFAVRRPSDAAEGRYLVHVTATSADRSFDHMIARIAYPHVRPTQWLRPATGEILLASIALPAVRSAGYVRGASDRVPEALSEVGLPVTVLGDEELARGDLGRYEVIVVGPRAYETDSALVRHNDRLLDYVRGGGRLIVQYQQYQFDRGTYAPFPIEIARPNARVTDETAPIQLLDPEHPVFRMPNLLTPADWEGWVQERGLYFAGSWDERYHPLLAMADPGDALHRGALLVARFGEGTYVYTGVSFFRSIPAGVPGALRLFLNLLAWEGQQ